MNTYIYLFIGWPRKPPNVKVLPFIKHCVSSLRKERERERKIEREAERNRKTERKRPENREREGERGKE